MEGERYRIQYTPTFGTATYQTATLDYRRYFFMRPFSLAFRGISLGRYGGGGQNVQMGQFGRCELDGSLRPSGDLSPDLQLQHL